MCTIVIALNLKKNPKKIAKNLKFPLRVKKLTLLYAKAQV